MSEVDAVDKVDPKLGGVDGELFNDVLIFS